MKKAIIKALIAGTAITTPTTAAFADVSTTITGKDVVHSIMDKNDVKECFNKALRIAAKAPDAEIKWDETLNSDGDYKYNLTAKGFEDAQKLRESIQFIARTGFSTKGTQVMLLAASVSAAGILEENIGSLSVAGMTSHYDNERSAQLADYTEQAEKDLRVAVYRCAYNQDIDTSQSIRSAVKYTLTLCHLP